MENNIGDARRAYADKVGKFTQEDAAQFFDVSLSTYKKWEQGQGMMNGAQLRAIAEKYGTTTDYLLKIDTDALSRVPTKAESDAMRKVALELSSKTTREDVFLEIAFEDDSKRLMSIFFSLSEEGQDKLVDYAEYLKSRYPKNEGVSMQEAM